MNKENNTNLIPCFLNKINSHHFNNKIFKWRRLHNNIIIIMEDKIHKLGCNNISKWCQNITIMEFYIQIQINQFNKFNRLKCKCSNLNNRIKIILILPNMKNYKINNIQAAWVAPSIVASSWKNTVIVSYLRMI